MMLLLQMAPFPDGVKLTQKTLALITEMNKKKLIFNSAWDPSKSLEWVWRTLRSELTSSGKRFQCLSRKPSTDIHHSRHLPASYGLPSKLFYFFSEKNAPRREHSLGTRTTSSNIPSWPRRAWRSDSWRDCHASSGWGCRPGRSIYGYTIGYAPR